MTKRLLIVSGKYNSEEQYFEDAKKGFTSYINIGCKFLIFDDNRLIISKNYSDLIIKSNPNLIKKFRDELLTCDEVYNCYSYAEVFANLIGIKYTNPNKMVNSSSSEYCMKSMISLTINILSLGHTEKINLNKDRINIFIKTCNRLKTTMPIYELMNSQFLNKVDIPLVDYVTVVNLFTGIPNFNIEKETIKFARETNQLKPFITKVFKECKKTKSAMNSVLDYIRYVDEDLKEELINCDEKGFDSLVKCFVSKLRADYSDFYVVYDFSKYIDFSVIDLDILCKRYNKEVLVNEFNIEFDEEVELPELYKKYVNYFQWEGSFSRAESFLDLCPVEDFNKYKKSFIQSLTYYTISSRSTYSFLNLNDIVTKENVYVLIKGVYEELEKRNNTKAIKFFINHLSKYPEYYNAIDITNYPKCAKIAMQQILKK